MRPLKVLATSGNRLAVNLSNPIEIRNVGKKAMQEAVGSVGMVKFMQQYDMGYGDYTKEKQEQPDISLDEIDTLLKK